MNTATVSKTGMEFAHRRAAKRNGNEIALRKDQLHSWNGNHVGMVIASREGTVWLTQTNDSTDIVLSPGESFRVSRPGQVVAQSLGAMARLVAR